MEGNEKDRVANRLREATSCCDEENKLFRKTVYTFIIGCGADATLYGQKKPGTALMHIGMQFETK